MIEWNVDPVLLHLGFLQVRWYGLLFMLGFVFGYLIAQRMFRLENKPEDTADRLVVYMFFGTLIGARLGHCLFYEPGYYLSHPLEIFKVWQGGLASHGGLIGIGIAIYLYSRKNAGQPFLWVLDRMSIVAALGAALIRLGNLFNSEIIGKPTDVPWAFIFRKVDALPRHPTQLYESLIYLIVFIFLLAIYRKKPNAIRHGWIAGFLLTTVFTMRFLIEFLKENQVAAEQGMALNIGQLLSMPAVLIGLYLMYRTKFRPYTTP